MRLTSPAFEDGGPIPEKYGQEYDDVNPPLAIGDVPAETEALALLLDDPDARESAGDAFDHWVVWNLEPGVSQIEEGTTPEGAREGRNDFGESGYGGPNPPDGEHTYRFRLYALDADLDLDGGASAEDLREAMDGHVLDESGLSGTYVPG